MAKQEILISINLKGSEAASKSTDKLAAATKRLAELQKQEAIELEKVNQQIKIQKDINTAAAKSSLGLANAAGMTAKQMKASRAQSGLNNAILLETSRLASDASYGFTAIANNLSQVVSLFQSFVKTNDGVVDSFKQLGKSIMGTGGIMIAVQLLISFGPQIFDFFMRLIGHSKNLREAMKDAAGEVKSTAGNFETYIRTLQDSTKSQEEQNDAIEALNKEFPNYIKQLEDANVTLKDVANNTDEAKKQNDLYRESIVKLAMARAAQNKIDELASKQLQEEIDVRTTALEKYGFSAEKVAEIEKEYNEIQENTTAKGRARSKELEKAFTTQERNVIKLIKARNEENESLDKQIDELIKFTDIQVEQDKKSGSSRKRRARIFKEADLDYEKELIASQDRIKKLETTNEKDLLLIQMDGMAERANLKQKEFEEDQARRLRDFLLSDATLKEKEEAERRYNNSIATSRESLNNYLIQLDEEYLAKLDDLESTRELEDLAGFGRALQDFNTERLKFQEEYLKSYTDSEIDRVEVAKLIEQDRFNNEMTNLKTLKAAKIAAGESTLAIDQQILNAEKANAEAKIALAEQERDAKIAIANQVGNAIVEVAGEGSTVGKAASIAMAVMNTREAFTAALGAKPYGPWNIAQAAAVLAMGMKQVKDIMATKIPGKEPSNGGGGGGVMIQAPDFNVVGASQTSQLAEAVSTAQQQPVKAFVVGKDISTQQELDRNITNTASFG
jgi:hypothetical protein